MCFIPLPRAWRTLQPYSLHQWALLPSVKTSTSFYNLVLRKRGARSSELQEAGGRGLAAEGKERVASSTFPHAHRSAPLSLTTGWGRPAAPGCSPGSVAQPCTAGTASAETGVEDKALRPPDLIPSRLPTDPSHLPASPPPAPRHIQAQSVVHALAHGSDARVILAVPGHLLQQFPHRFHQVVHGLEVRAAAVQDACAGRGRSGETRSRVGTQAV